MRTKLTRLLYVPYMATTMFACMFTLGALFLFLTLWNTNSPKSAVDHTLTYMSYGLADAGMLFITLVLVNMVKLKVNGQLLQLPE